MAAAPPSVHMNHWYQNRRAWGKEGMGNSPRGWKGRPIVAILVILAGHRAASRYAARAPQSWPATEKMDMPRASARSMMSWAIATPRPSRIVSFFRKRVGPKARRYGMMVRKPAALRAGATWPHARMSSGQPCKRKMGGPLRGPSSMKDISRSDVFMASMGKGVQYSCRVILLARCFDWKL